MSNDRRKWYVVWRGTEPGICDSWAECESRVKGYPGARYKAFNTQEEAVEAFRNDPGEMDILRAIARAPREYVNYEAIPEIVWDSIAVDGACSGNPGIMEYRGVDVQTGAELFHQGPFPDATNNIGEFLAIVHGLSYLKKHRLNQIIYSDSVNAISWVRQKVCKSKLVEDASTAELWDYIHRAENWLRTNSYTTEIRKWDTDNWGEIPADFGRK